jgi:hypothetical protein
MILSRLTEAEHARLEQLIETPPTGFFPEFNRLREVLKSATFTHLEAWTARLTWLLSLGDMTRLLADFVPAKITHFATQAGLSLHLFTRILVCCDFVIRVLDRTPWCRQVLHLASDRHVGAAGWIPAGLATDLVVTVAWA